MRTYLLVREGPTRVDHRLFAALDVIVVGAVQELDAVPDAQIPRLVERGVT